MFRLGAVGLALLIAACDDTPVTLEISGETMGTTYNITAVAPAGGLDSEALKAAVEATLAQVNASMSNWDPGSEISRFNALRHTEPVPISAGLADVIEAADEIHSRSDGLFDLTLAPLIELWGFGAREAGDPIPSEAEISAALEQVGQSRIITLTRGPDTLQKARPDASIYLAAIGKGHGVDEVAATLRGLGLQDFMVEIGGDLFASGQSPGNEPWRIGIERPDATDRALQEIIELSSQGMATSGDYRNYFEEDGIRYSHIIDANTGRPITHKTASVTVIAETAMLADGWATAMLVLGRERGLEIAEAYDLAVFFISRSDALDDKDFAVTASTRFQALQAEK
ncbi:MAG: FAD:protein FMN transferase [Pseudomonadota bacterium]